MHENQRTELHVLFKSMIIQNEEMENQFGRAIFAVLKSMQAMAAISTELSPKMPEREIEPYFDEESIRSNILVDPLNKKSRKYSLSG